MLLFLFFWLVLWILQMTYEYLKFQTIHTLHPFYFSYEISNFYPYLQYILHKPLMKSTCRIIFYLGSFIMLMILLLSPLLFIYLVSNLHISESYSIRNEDHYGHVSSLVVPLVPLVNIPSSYLLSFWVFTLLSSFIHELGHGVAAYLENIHIEKVGIFFVLFFPGAYVTLDSNFQKLDIFARMRIYSAGIAFNFILATICFITLMSLPTLLFLLYRRSSGVVISSIHSLNITQQLSYGTTILSINGENVNSNMQFQQILWNIDQSSSLMSHHLKLHLLQKYDPAFSETYLRPTNESQAFRYADFIHMNPGYCVQLDFVHPTDVSCCIDLLSGVSEITDIPSSTCFLNSREWTMTSFELFCSDVRIIYEPYITKFNQHCNNDNDCISGKCLKVLTRR